jgi:hypothetical protein
MGGGGGVEDNSAQINEQLVQMVTQANQAIVAESQRQTDMAKATSQQAAMEAYYRDQQSQWEAQSKAQMDAMAQMQNDAAAKAQEMRQIMEEEAARQAELERQRVLAQEEADKLTAMKTGMANDATNELDANALQKKRRATLQPIKTLLTSGQGLTTDAPVQAKTLLGQ